METNKLFGVPLHKLGHITPKAVSEYIYDFFEVPREDRCVDNTTTQFSFISHGQKVNVVLSVTDDVKPFVYEIKISVGETRDYRPLNVNRFDKLLKRKGFQIDNHIGEYARYNRTDAQLNQYGARYNEGYFSFCNLDIYDEVTAKKKKKEKEIAEMNHNFWSNLKIV
jgi:hypothetical protein